ncbi:MAG: hypothetical protein WDM89_20550 [Rhizomicrobium sp.]
MRQIRLTPNEWTPDAQTISHIDALALKLELPKEFGSIGDYSRFYYGTMHAGRKVIIGTFVSPQVQKAEHRRVTSGIHIVPESNADWDRRRWLHAGQSGI